MGNSPSARRVRKKKSAKEMSAEGKRAFLESTGASPPAESAATDDVEAALAKGMQGLSVSSSTSSSSSSSSSSRRRSGSQKKKDGYQLKVKQPVMKSLEPEMARKSETQFKKQNNLASTPPSNRTAYPSKKWSPHEDELLRNAVAEYNGKNWKAIAQRVPNKTHLQCLQRWKKVLQPGLIKGHWTEEEDDMLRSLVDESGNTSWVAVAKYIPGRTAKQCRERWSLNLDPSINREPWTPEEDKYLLELHTQLGNKWAEISGHMNGRTENAVKTRFKSIVRAMQKQWTPAEDRVLVDAKATASNRWVAIASQLPGRSKNAVRQRWKYLVAEYPNLDEVVATDSSYVMSLPYYMQNAYHPSHALHAEMRPSAFAQAAMASRPPPIPEHVPAQHETHESRVRALPPLEHVGIYGTNEINDIFDDVLHRDTTSSSSLPDSASVANERLYGTSSGHGDHFGSATASPSAYSTDGEASRLMDAHNGYENSPQHGPVKVEAGAHHHSAASYSDPSFAKMDERAVKYEPFTTHQEHHHYPAHAQPLTHQAQDTSLYFDNFGSAPASAPESANGPASNDDMVIPGLEVAGSATGLEEFVLEHPGQAFSHPHHDVSATFEPAAPAPRGPMGILANTTNEMSATSFTSQDQYMLIDALQDAPADVSPPKIMIR